MRTRNFDIQNKEDMIICMVNYNSEFIWRVAMKISYKKLWKLLIDRDMLKKDLASKAEISSTSIAKLSKNENVNTEILRKICTALECDISDIMEMIDDKESEKK